MEKDSGGLYFWNMDIPYVRIRVRSAGQSQCDAEWTFEHHHYNYDHFMLWVVRSGRGLFSSREQEWKLRSNDCYVLRMWNPYSCDSDADDPMDFYWIWFQLLDESGNTVDLEHKEQSLMPALHRRIHDMTFFSGLLDRVIESVGEHGGDSEESNAWMEVVLKELAREDAMPRLSGPEKEQYERIAKICRQIEKNPGKNYRVEDLSAAAHWSHAHFARTFRKFKGVSPRRFITLSKIERAKSLLHGSSYSVSQIADLLGYGDVFHFSKQFKQTEGVSPSEYRRM